MLKEQAALALGNLAGDNDHNRVSIRESCGIPALVAVPRGGTNVQNEQATRALRPLACGPNDTGDAICEPEGGDIQAMDTISVGGLILRGRTVMGRQGVSGVYRNDDGYTYAGDVDVGSGAANGRGVHKWSDGTTWYGGWSAGKRHGHSVSHWDTGDIGYWLWEHGRWLHKALVFDDTRCKYDDRECSAEHPEFAALKAAAGLVEVRPGSTVPAVQHPNATPRSPQPCAPARFARAGACKCRRRRGLGDDRGERGRRDRQLATRRQPARRWSA